jgi:hypothetical protein
MSESILFYGFVITIIPYVIINVLVIFILKEEGYTFSIINNTLPNYRSLKELANNKSKYRWLYIAYIGFTLLPILIFVLFVLFIFL